MKIRRTRKGLLAIQAGKLAGKPNTRLCPNLFVSNFQRQVPPAASIAALSVPSVPRNTHVQNAHVHVQKVHVQNASLNVNALNVNPNVNPLNVNPLNVAPLISLEEIKRLQSKKIMDVRIWERYITLFPFMCCAVPCVFLCIILYCACVLLCIILLCIIPYQRSLTCPVLPPSPPLEAIVARNVIYC